MTFVACPTAYLFFISFQKNHQHQQKFSHSIETDREICVCGTTHDSSVPVQQQYKAKLSD